MAIAQNGFYWMPPSNVDKSGKISERYCSECRAKIENGEERAWHCYKRRIFCQSCAFEHGAPEPGATNEVDRRRGRPRKEAPVVRSQAPRAASKEDLMLDLLRQLVAQNKNAPTGAEASPSDMSEEQMIADELDQAEEFSEDSDDDESGPSRSELAARISNVIDHNNKTFKRLEDKISEYQADAEMLARIKRIEAKFDEMHPTSFVSKGWFDDLCRRVKQLESAIEPLAKQVKELTEKVAADRKIRLLQERDILQSIDKLEALSRSNVIALPVDTQAED